MNFSRLSVLVGAAAISVTAVSVAAPANALNFNFSITNVDGSVSGSFTGTVTGLADNASNQVATQVTINPTYPPGLGTPTGGSLIATNWSTRTFNSFTVSGGIITAANFEARNGPSLQDLFCINSAGGPGCSPGINGISFNSGNPPNLFNTNGFSGVTFTSAAVPFDIPGGATIPAVGGLLALGLMRKARKSLAPLGVIRNS